MVIGTVLLMLATAVGGAPSITFPINSQVPSVARVAKPFNFVFSSFTFTSTTASMDYTLLDPPKWLQLDSASRTLSGTPGPGDEGAVVVTLTATDSTGSTDLASTLIVSASPGPSLGSSVAEQLPSLGTTLNSTTLALYPSAPFSFAFKSNTFLDTNGNTVFYAVSADNAPLPSWVHFDPTSLTFSGNTPPSSSPSAPPDYFGIQLTASDVVGFAGATTAFTIVVGVHKLLFTKSQQTVNFTEGRDLDFTDLRSQLQLDGKTIPDQDLRQAKADVPAWLKFDNETLGISGTPPRGTTSLTISIEVFDGYGDTANTTVLLQSTSTLFSGKIDNLNATIGHDFTYTFSQSLLTDHDVQISVDLGKASSWLRYDSQTLTIQGHVPKDITPQDFELNVTASKGATMDSQTILLTVGSSDTPVTASSSLSSTTDAIGSPSSSSASPPRSTALGLSNDGGLSKGAIAAIVLLPCLTILGAVLLSLYLLRRRRRVAGIKTPNNRPLLAQDNPEPDPEMAELRESRHVRAPSVPRINWKPSTSRRSSHIRLPGESIEESEIQELSAPKDSVVDTHSKYMKDTEINLRGPESRAEFAIALDESATTRRNTLHNPRKRPTSRHLSAALTDMTQSRRNSRRTNRDSAMSFKSTSQKRLSGVGHGKSVSRPTSRGSLTTRTSVGGHGKGDFGPANHGLVRRSIWSPRSTWTPSESGSSNYQESETTMQKTDSFPQPPRPSTTYGTTARPGIRTVTEQDQTPTRTRSQKRLSACTARQSYLDNRARARHSTNPFLSAGSSSTRALSHRSRNPLSPTSLGGTSTSRSGSFHPSENTIHHSTSISREPTQRTQRSYSKSSSLDAPLRPPSRKISSPRKSIGARVVARLAQSRSPERRGQSPSKASVTGSSRFESAASSRLDLAEGGEDRDVGQLVGKGKGKGKGKEKSKERGSEKEEWRHAGHLNPLAANTANPGDGKTSERVVVGSDAPGPSRTNRTADGEQRLLRLSLFFAPGESAADDPVMRNFRRTLQRAWGDEGDDVGDGDGDGGADGGVFGEGEGDGEGRARFVEENKGKRPTSVEVGVGGQSRNKSLRGNLGNVGNMGKVGDGREEGVEGDEGDERDEWNEQCEANEGDETKERDEGKEGDEGNEGNERSEANKRDEGKEGDKGKGGNERSEANEGNEGNERISAFL